METEAVIGIIETITKVGSQLMMQRCSKLVIALDIIRHSRN